MPLVSVIFSVLMYFYLNHSELYIIIEFFTNSLQYKNANNCNSMPFGAAWAYYGKVLVLANAAS